MLADRQCNPPYSINDASLFMTYTLDLRSKLSISNSTESLFLYIQGKINKSFAVIKLSFE